MLLKKKKHLLFNRSLRLRVPKSTLIWINVALQGKRRVWLDYLIHGMSKQTSIRTGVTDGLSMLMELNVPVLEM